MRRKILICIAACLYYSGLVACARWWMRWSGRGVLIVNYHRASGGDLARHLLYLRRHYRLIPMEEALDELYHSPQRSQRGDQRTPLVLTFDDGYQDNYSHAFALARKLHVPLTIYLVPGYMDELPPGESSEPPRQFWWLESRRLLRHATAKTIQWQGRTYSVQEEQVELTALIDREVRYASSVAARESFLATMRSRLAVSSLLEPEEFATLPLSWTQVREMKESGLITFGAHTMHHPILAALSNEEELYYEVAECRKSIEQQLGSAVESFAYPFGQRQHISKQVWEAVHRAGDRGACVSHYGVNTSSSNPYLLKRIEMDVDQHWLVIAAEAAGLWGFFSRLRWIPLVRRYFTNATN